jgi:hypothetical protein
MMKLRAVLLLALLCAPLLVTKHAHAQAKIVSSCGAQSLTVGDLAPTQFMTGTGLLCVNATGGGGGSVTQGTVPWVVALNTTPSLANGSGIVPTQGGAVLSATNGQYTNLLQGNAVLATGNPIFAQLTAGSAILGKVGIDQTTPGTTNGVVINPVSGTPNQVTVTCGTSATSLLAALTATTFLAVQNPPNVANTVWINYAGASAVTAPPSWAIVTGASQTWSTVNGYVPTSAVSCISTPGAQAVTLSYK